MTTHTFNSTSEAYDACQWNDEIRDGDVLLVPSEGVAGVLIKAWPAAVTPEHGAFHGVLRGWDEVEGGAYKDSADAAILASKGF